LLSDINENPEGKNSLKAFPNPVTGEFLYFNKAINGTVYNAFGRIIFDLKDVSSINIKSLLPGLYFIKTSHGEVIKFVVQ